MSDEQNHLEIFLSQFKELTEQIKRQIEDYQKSTDIRLNEVELEVRRIKANQQGRRIGAVH